MPYADIGRCALPSSEQHQLYRAACDPTRREYGLKPMVVSADNATLLTDTRAAWEDDAQLAAMWPRLIQARTLANITSISSDS